VETKISFIVAGDFKISIKTLLAAVYSVKMQNKSSVAVKVEIILLYNGGNT
jgi:hypothetical protein